MALLSIGNQVGFTDKRHVSRGGSGSVSVATPANYADVTAMRTRLTAINAGYFTAARLNQMSHNDMAYAIRLADDAASA